jgi:light-regulated signal transduction histidine kinase (bacteriophytochrome)
MPLANLFSQKDLDHLIAGTAGEGKRHYVHRVRTTHTETTFDALVHRYHGLLIVELELESLTADAAGQSMCVSLTDAIAQLDAPLPLPALCECVAACVRRFTGFDRVMVYRFLNDDTGEVIAENKREDLVPYLGLRYPASDIPPQARRLYLLNTLRLKADVNAPNAVLIPELNPFTGAPLDMTFCVLRSMSPVHVEYLRNMGVAASMSISIVKDGKLWGLIACHHAQAKLVPYPVRLPCEVLARVFSSHIAAAEAVGQRASATALQEVNKRMQARMRRLRNAVSALSEGNDDIMHAIGAQGCAVSIGGKLILSGITPKRQHVEELLNWLGIHQDQHVFDTEPI